LDQLDRKEFKVSLARKEALAQLARMACQSLARKDRKAIPEEQVLLAAKVHKAIPAQRVQQAIPQCLLGVLYTMAMRPKMLGFSVL
jgi:hypothetical protein